MSVPGRLAVVLHSHMPYVVGFGVWPFGEEWLWEALATSYLPLLDVLDARPGRVTLSVTPVLADQLAEPCVSERFRAFAGELRPASHRLDLEATSVPAERAALEHNAERYAAALAAFDRRGGDVVGALAGHATWTSSATHAVLPLLATDAGIALQVATGVAAHRARSGTWSGGLWLPECAWAPWLDGPLAACGARAVCVDLTDVFGRGAAEHLRPLRRGAGPVLVPLDRASLELVWSDGGYPGAAAYADTHRLTARRHPAWRNDGAPYDPARAAAQARADAERFADRIAERLAGGGLCVVAMDTELLGDWWPEGVTWLAEALDACEARGVPVVPLDDALEDAETAPAPAALPVTSWGTPRDLATWSAPAAGGLAWRQREAELRTLAAGAAPPDRALRELLAAQASDWAFLVSRDTAGPYPRERVAGHLAALDAALADPGAQAADLRGLAPWLARWPLTL